MDQDTSRREFLGVAGASLGLMAMAGIGAAEGEKPPKLLQALFPGSVDAAGVAVLPGLTYGYDALEPFIDAATMALHHDKHHAAYVKGFNDAEAKLAEMRKSGTYDLIEHWEAKSAFHGAGHFLHSVFWDSMMPKAPKDPSAALAKLLEAGFGTVDAFKAQFSAAAKTVEGSGWAILGWSLPMKRLVVLQARNHQMQTPWSVLPVACLDVWEHAYYLQYRNDRAKYVENWWNVVAWERIEARLETARAIGA